MTKVMQKLEKNLIQTCLLFAGNIIHQPVFDELTVSNNVYRIVGELVNIDKVMNDSFWVGVYFGLIDEMIKYMIDKISDCFRK